MLRLLTAVLLLADVASAAPVRIAHQGRLVDAAGAPLTGPRDVTLSLHAAATGSGALWSRTFTALPLESGTFSVELERDNENDPIDPSWLAGDVWLGVSVASIGELGPRLRLHDVPTATVARHVPVEGAPGSSSCGEAGALVFDTSTSALRVCDGTSWTGVASGGGGTAPAVANSGSAYTIPASLEDGQIARVRLTANATITLPSGPSAAGSSMRLYVEPVQDATGGRTLTWAAPAGQSLLWHDSSAAPAIAYQAGKRTLFEFIKFSDDTAWRGRLVFRQQSLPTPGTQAFVCTNANQTFVVPDGVTALNVKMWGAGGAGAVTASSHGKGGAGGFAGATLPVDPGETVTVIVGCGGITSTDQAGGGGGRSALRIDGIEVLTAGGGGGGAYDGWGGAGGGTTAQGAPIGNQSGLGIGGQGGGGANTSTGGSPGSCSCQLYGNAPQGGTQYTGGIGTGTPNGSVGGFGGGAPGGTSHGGGGGGGGYFGGGGGFGHSGGGGGSGYGPVGATLTAGSGQTPGNSLDPDRAGAAGGGNVNGNGGNGRVVLSWGS